MISVSTGENLRSIIVKDALRAYFPIAENCFTVLRSCHNIDGVSFLKQFPWINCSSSEYAGLLFIAVIQVFYVIILPFVVFCYFRFPLGRAKPESFMQGAIDRKELVSSALKS